MEAKNGFSNKEITEIMHKYSDFVRKICFIYLRNYDDVEDVFQDVFIKLLQKSPTFESEEHTKAWLCRVAINKCKDTCKSYWRKNVFSFEDNKEQMQYKPFENYRENEIIDVVLSLPTKYKDVIYLFYYEDYSVQQIASLLKQKENTIYSKLHRARKLLKEKLGGDQNDYEF